MDRPAIAPTEPISEAAVALALAVAAHGLPSSQPLPSDPVSPETFRDLLTVAENERLVGALVEAVVDGALPTDEQQLRSLAELHLLWSRHALDVEAQLVRLDAAFAAADIGLRVLKGVAYAHVGYANPSFRLFGDLDVLVPATRIDEAVRVACDELGAVQPFPELRAGFDQQFGKAVYLTVGRIELDVHRTFVAGPFGLTIDLDELFATSTPFTLGGRALHALDGAALVLHACYNVALGDLPARLGPLRDLGVLSTAVGADPAEVSDLADAWRARAVVQRAAELTVEGLGLSADHPLCELTRLPVTRAERWLLRSYLTPARSYSRALASLAVIRGVRARFRYARALAFPSSEYLRRRGWTERSHLRRARDRLLGRG